MKNWLLLFTTLIFIFSSTVTAESKIYHWVDENGKNYFSDTAGPVANNEEINVRNQNLLIHSEVQETQETDLQIDVQSTAKIANIYQAEITSPQDKSSIRSNDGTLNIQVQIAPEKENNQKLQLYLDGKKLGKPQLSSTMRALNIARGTHQVQVYLLDSAGNELAKTQIVTIYLQRTIVNNAN